MASHRWVPLQEQVVSFRTYDSILVANSDNKLEAAAAAVCLMGLAGEIAYDRMQDGDGNSTYRNRIIDAIYNMDGDTLEKGAKYEIK